MEDEVVGTFPVPKGNSLEGAIGLGVVAAVFSASLVSESGKSEGQIANAAIVLWPKSRPRVPLAPGSTR